MVEKAQCSARELNCKQEEAASRYNNNNNTTTTTTTKNVSSVHSLNFKTISTTLLAQGPLNHTILNTYTVYTRQKTQERRKEKKKENQKNTDHCCAVCCAITLSTCRSYIASCRRLLGVVEKAKSLFCMMSECVPPACSELVVC